MDKEKWHEAIPPCLEENKAFVKAGRILTIYWQGMKQGWRRHWQMWGTLREREDKKVGWDAQRAGGRYGLRLAGIQRDLVMWTLCWDSGDSSLSLKFGELHYCLWQVTLPPHASDFPPTSSCLSNQHQQQIVKRCEKKDKLCWDLKMSKQSLSQKARWFCAD